MAHYRGCSRHEDRPQPCGGSLDDGVQLVAPPLLQLIREFNDQNAILRYESDQSDQSDLAVDVEGYQPQEGKRQRPGNGKRHGARQNDKWVAETLKLRR